MTSMSHFLFPVLLGLLSCLLTQGPVTVSAIREPYSRTAIVYPSDNALRSVSGRPTNDYTLTVVLPIGLALFILILIFFCWVATEHMNNASYEEMENEPEPVEVDDGYDYTQRDGRPYPVIDQILDLPYTPHVPLDDDM